MQLANGFDFAVTAHATDADGATTTLELPSRGRVGAELEGAYTIEFKTPDGTSMAKKEYKFATGNKRKEGCQEYVNVLGSAAIFGEDIAYGMGMKAGGNVATIESLLAKKADVGDQSRIRAWNLGVAVHEFDPENPRLPPLGPKSKAARHKMIDTFKSGPLAGKAKADCLTNAEALFPDTRRRSSVAASTSAWRRMKSSLLTMRRVQSVRRITSSPSSTSPVYAKPSFS